MDRPSDAVRGLYAVTPEHADTRWLAAAVRSALSGGARLVQYRSKSGDPALRRRQAEALAEVCREFGRPLIINDDARLAAAVDAAGVHVGAGDLPVAGARHIVGAQRLVGVSCYNRIDLARAAEQAGADYVAFGSFFPSTVKPGAVAAPLALLAEARASIQLPIVAIGGITAENASALLAAGADALAVISAVFGAEDLAAAAARFGPLFREPVVGQRQSV